MKTGDNIIAWGDVKIPATGEKGISLGVEGQYHAFYEGEAFPHEIIVDAQLARFDYCEKS